MYLKHIFQLEEVASDLRHRSDAHVIKDGGKVKTVRCIWTCAMSEELLLRVKWYYIFGNEESMLELYPSHIETNLITPSANCNIWNAEDASISSLFPQS